MKTTMRFLRSTVVLATALPLAACGDPTGVDPIEQLPRDLTAAELSVIGGSNTFAFDLLAEAYAAETEPNVFLSPLSASMALGMAMNGADGETWTQMRDALRFEGLDEPAINESYHDLIELLLGLDPTVTFGLANSVWARDGVEFEQPFFDRVTTHFDARVEALDFEDPATLGVINGWVDQQTNGRIEEIIDAIDPLDIMYLINAVYFKGTWTTQFDPGDTRTRQFRRADDTYVEVPMMSLEEADFRSFGTVEARGVELPYGGGAFTAVGVLPAGGTDLATLLAGLDAATWDAWMDELDAAEPEEITVALPRFELEYDRQMKDDLSALGMVDAFDPDISDFSRLTPYPDAHIAKVRQKTFVKVDEEGTEAAAVTAVTVRYTSAGPMIMFDEPFLFAIRERFSGTILFIGVIGDPTA